VGLGRALALAAACAHNDADEPYAPASLSGQYRGLPWVTVRERDRRRLRMDGTLRLSTHLLGWTRRLRCSG
jgi:hypothetical protein